MPKSRGQKSVSCRISFVLHLKAVWPCLREGSWILIPDLKELCNCNSKFKMIWGKICHLWSWLEDWLVSCPLEHLSWRNDVSLKISSMNWTRYRCCALPLAFSTGAEAFRGSGYTQHFRWSWILFHLWLDHPGDRTPANSPDDSAVESLGFRERKKRSIKCHLTHPSP